MKTSDPNVLREFMTVLNRKKLTEAVYKRLLEIWGLDKIDLEAEMEKINQKKSTLTKSRRDAVPEFLRMKGILDEIKNAQQSTMDISANEAQDIQSDTLTV